MCYQHKTSLQFELEQVRIGHFEGLDEYFKNELSYLMKFMSDCNCCERHMTNRPSSLNDKISYTSYECSVCYGKFRKCNMNFCKKCKKKFCVKCIDKWCIYNVSCPMCRYKRTRKYYIFDDLVCYNNECKCPCRDACRRTVEMSKFLNFNQSKSYIRCDIDYINDYYQEYIDSKKEYFRDYIDNHIIRIIKDQIKKFQKLPEDTKMTKKSVKLYIRLNIISHVHKYSRSDGLNKIRKKLYEHIDILVDDLDFTIKDYTDKMIFKPILIF